MAAMEITMNNMCNWYTTHKYTHTQSHTHTITHTQSHTDTRIYIYIYILLLTYIYIYKKEIVHCPLQRWNYLKGNAFVGKQKRTCWWAVPRSQAVWWRVSTWPTGKCITPRSPSWRQARTDTSIVHETQLGLFHGFKLFWALGVFINGGTQNGYLGKSYKNGMIWGYPHFRKLPYVKVFPPIFGYWGGFTTNS